MKRSYEDTLQPLFQIPFVVFRGEATCRLFFRNVSYLDQVAKTKAKMSSDSAVQAEHFELELELVKVKNTSKRPTVSFQKAYREV